ncbi:hypothetical protein MPTK1_1g11930 [Marchantia polymorpha subsp. ruderalis]|uniref:Uncharacterized protein n=2 Tax=Marchantia polymorpha TaxID=3197 RepID=A0AAF6AP66_MARPO|nr:hypothetical protein MARPO_0014s0036 [Marchantia polymorpha]BBM98236.1 hypothetical protein Mp_1g11930 [Marchantia polymorpha subsp. ruderalis]|eukprot:PTQ45486.1 hypothetical protein MARPO_0014s0036 [Marchantia polymorpha]
MASARVTKFYGPVYLVKCILCVCTFCARVFCRADSVVPGHLYFSTALVSRQTHLISIASNFGSFYEHSLPTFHECATQSCISFFHEHPLDHMLRFDAAPPLRFWQAWFLLGCCRETIFDEDWKEVNP